MQRGLFFIAILILFQAEGLSAKESRPYIVRNASGEIRWVQSDNYYTLSGVYVTPHIEWAKPLAGGSIRALIISPRACHRETVELAQRLSLDYEFVMMPGKPDEWAPENQFKFLHLDPEEAVAGYEEKLNRDYDIIVLANCQWDAFPAEYEKQLLEKFDRGTGIVLTYQWEVKSPTLTALPAKSRDTGAERWISQTVPVDRIPGLAPSGQDTPPLVTCVSSGKGRLVRLEYPSELKGYQTVNSLTPLSPEDRVLPDVLYDYYQSLVAKSVLWASRKDSGIRIEEIVPPTASGEAANLPPVTVVTSASHGMDCSVLAVARDWWGEERVSAEAKANLPAGTASVELALPRLPGGTHFVDIWLKDADGGVLDWASILVDSTSIAEIRDIQLDRRSYPAGPVVGGTVAFGGEPSEDSRLRIELKDSFGRLLASREVTVDATQAAFRFDFPQPVAIQHEVVASILDSRGLVHQSRKLFAVSGLVYDDFACVLWGANGRNNYRERLISRAACELGVDSSYGYGKTSDWLDNPCAYWTTRAGLSQFFYGTYLGGLPDENHVRSCCLSDPQVRESHAAGIRELAAANKHMGGIGYSTGDEYRLSDQGEDLCWSKYCLARLRGRLQTKYHTLDALNETWRSNFDVWEKVVPDTIEQARQKGDYTSWAENREFSEFVFADIHRYLREAVESVHEGPPVGEEGMFDSDTYFGVDWEKFRYAATLIHGYERPQQHEKMRSLAPKTAMTGYWVGYYNRDYAEERMRWHPWHSLLTGFNSAWWWTAAMIAEESWPAGFASDLTPQDPFKWMMEEVREIKRGIGKLILNAERQHDGIAILYSMPSTRAADAHPQITVPLGSEHYEGTIKSSELAWCFLLEDLGLQYEFVSHRDVAKGALLSGEHSVLVLPTSVAMTEGEANAIRAFVRNGGTVFADLWPGIMDEWGNILPQGQLDDVFGMTQSGLEDLETIDLSWNEEKDFRLPKRHSNRAVELENAEARTTSQGIPALVENAFAQGAASCLNFSINDYFSDWHAPEEHQDIRWQPEGTVLREYVRNRLAEAGVAPRISLKKEDGTPLVGCEAVFFKRGDLLYLGLQYVADNLYFHMGSEDFLFSHYSLEPDCTPVPVRIGLDETYHVYNMRAQHYLGYVKEVDTTIAPGEAILLALLPYQTSSLTLVSDSEVGQVRVSPDNTRAYEPVRFRAGIGTTARKPELHSFRVDVYDPHEREVKEYGQNVLARAGKASFTIPFALNDERGPWRVRVTDVATGLQSEMQVGLSD